VTTWLVVLAVGAGSYLLRLGPLLLLERARPSEGLERGIRHGGLAAVAALVALSTRDAATSGSPVGALAAVGVAVVLAARKAPMHHLLAAGGAVYALAVIAG
jgi:hypothetical protein